jgi:glycosyltransferase involved in cell wall biosynthesis
MHIGFVTGEYPPMEGGVGAYTRELARALVARGHQVSVFTRAAAAQANEPDIQIAAQIAGHWGWKTSKAVQAWVKVRKPDIINIQFQTAAYDMHPAIHWLPSGIKRPPVVVTFHDLRVPYLFPRAGSVREWIVRKLAHDANGVISTDRADLRKIRDGWQINRAVWIPIGSNVRPSLPAEYERSQWRATLGIQPDDLLVSYFGFLNESKGGLVLVEALGILRDMGIPASLLMVGGRAGDSDPSNLAYAERVDALIDSLNLAAYVHWTGFIDDSTVSGHLLASDITALPYLDGVSLRRGTLMAALAHGRAVVTTTAQSEIPELATALEMVPPGDPYALASAIVDVWKSPARRTAMEQHALEAARSFDWDSIATRTLEFFQALQP